MFENYHSVKFRVIQKPVNWFAEQIHWPVSL